MRNKIYIFSITSRASAYGIGTYITQLIECLIKAKIDFTIIHLYSEKKIIKETKENGYSQIYIPAANGSLNSKNNHLYVRNISYLLKSIIQIENHIQPVFHLNFMNNETLVKNLKKHFKCKIILTAHYTEWSFSLLGNETKLNDIMSQKYSQIKDPVYRQIFKLVKEDEKMIKKSDRFVCVAEHTFKSLDKVINIDKEKTFVINNALKDEYKPISQTRYQQLRKKYLITPDTKVIFFAGRLDEVKGVEFLIQSFKNVLKSKPEAHLIIAGEGNFYSCLTQARNHWPKISFTGKLNKKQLYEFYHIADIGIVSSLHEEFGFVAIEMMMHQLPIIVTDTGGLAEIVENNISGLKVPIKIRKSKRTIDTQLLTKKINYLLDNPTIAHNIAIEGRKKFLEKYELSLFKEKMMNLYLNI